MPSDPVAQHRGPLLRPYRDTLTDVPPCPRAVIPVSRDGWLSVLADADVRSGFPLRDALALVPSRAGQADHGPAIDLARRLSDEAQTFSFDLWCASTFRPASGGHVAQLRDAIIAAAVAAIDVLCRTESTESLQSATASITERLAEVRALEATYPFPEDPCEAAFSVARDQLTDERGIFSAARLLSSFYQRYEDLQDRLHTLLSVLTDKPPDLLSAVWPAEALLLTARPLIALRTAVRVRNLLERQIKSNLTVMAVPLRELKLGVDASADNQAGMADVVRRLGLAESDLERARLTLDLYRRMVEGQLRPWAWTLLRLHGHHGGRAPMLSSLRDRLVAGNDSLLTEAARAILPAARNAAAHEDASWDEVRIVLRTHAGEVTVEELEDATERAYAFMAGAECAWACVRFASPAFAQALDEEDPRGGLRGVSELAAIRHFGTNGLAVRRWTNERGVVTVVIDRLPVEAINPCFQAAMWASRHLERATRVIVTVPDRQLPVLDLSRPALDATFLVWLQARAHFEQMPTSTFLPSNAWARLSVETPDVAAQAAAWLALTDAVSAYDEAMAVVAPIARQAAILAPRLDLASTAVAATMATLPMEAATPLRTVLRLLHPAATWAASGARGGPFGPSAQLELEIRRLQAALPAAAPLPTLDPRPFS